MLQKAISGVALAVDNHLRSQEAISYEKYLQQERDRTRLLLGITNSLVRSLDLKEVFGAISSALRRVIHHDYAALILLDSHDKSLRTYAIDFPHEKGSLLSEVPYPIEGSIAGRVFRSGKPLLIGRLDVDLQEFPVASTRALLAERIKSACCFPLIRDGPSAF